MKGNKIIPNLFSLKIFVRTTMFVFVLNTSGCETLSTVFESVSICVLESSVGCITFKGKSSEKENFEKIQRLLQRAKQKDSPQEKIRLYQDVLAELSPLSDKTAAEVVKNMLNQEINRLQDYEVEVSTLLTKARNKVSIARKKSSIEEKRNFYKEALVLLDRVIKDYSHSVQLIQAEIQRSEIEKEYHDFFDDDPDEVDDDPIIIEDDLERNVQNFRGQLVRTLTGHRSVVWSLSYSPDGKQLASGSCGKRDDDYNCTAGEIRLWDVATGREIRTLTGHRSKVKSLSYSPDGTQLASGGCGTYTNGRGCTAGEIRLWDVATGREIRKLTGHGGYVNTLSYSPDGTQLASGGCDNVVSWANCRGRYSRREGYILVWDVATGREIRKLTGHRSEVLSVSYSPDGMQLASGSYDNTIRLWDVATGRHIGILTGHRGDVTTLSYSPDGTQLASAGFSSDIWLWDVATGRHIRTLTGHRGIVNSVSYSPDGKQLASGSSDNTIGLWDVATGRPIRILRGHSYSVNFVLYSPDGKQIVSGSVNTIKIWE